jgi:double-stranded uracil-DNA glycosylase
VKRPTPKELEDARTKRVGDVIARDLRVLFCGINPGLYSGATGHHFARPGNRFWPALHQSGFTEQQLEPENERQLLEHGLGVTNVAGRVTATAGELTKEELQRGATRLKEKVTRYSPHILAVLGIGSYRTGFGRPDAVFGLQPERISDARVWVLPNPSGLNAHYTLPALVERFEELRVEADRSWAR